MRRLFVGCMALLLAVTAAAAWAQDRTPKYGVDASAVRSPVLGDLRGRSCDEARAELDAAGVTHIVSHGAVVDGEAPDIRPYVEALWGPEVAAGARVVESFPFVYSGTTVSTDGRSAGTRELAVWVYELPPPADR